jgi:hypothetical protein
MAGIGDNFDPVFIARETGRGEGESIGRQIGYNAGHKDGYNEGFNEGHKVGWDAAIARANEEILKQMEFTRQHVTDKETMAQQLREQQTLIEQLTARLDEMERENGNLINANKSLRQVVTALKEANERLQAEVGKLDEKYKARSQEYLDEVWQHNRSMVFMNAVRCTLEELTSGSGSQARQVRAMFAQKYGDSVSNALNQGSIKIAPDKDETFAKTLPKTQKFILDMLSSVATNAPLNIREQMMQQVQPAPSKAAEDEPSFGM